MTKYLALATLVLLGSFAGTVALIQVSAFTQPSEPPPSCTAGNPGCDVPLNVSSTSQTKQGALTIQGDLSAARFCSVTNPALCVDLNGTSYFGGNIDLSNMGRLTNYMTGYVPQGPGDLATKAYVDSKIPPPPAGGQKRVFVSSVSYTGNMSKAFGDTLSGIPLANKRCQDLANGQSLGGQWAAWLSSTSVNATDNILCSNNKEYWTVDQSRRVARDCDDLTDGSLGTVINVNENRQLTSNTYVWTGTNIAGTTYNPTYTCQDWTDNTQLRRGYVGHNGYTSNNWTAFTSTSCNTSRQIYCFEL